MKRSTLRSLLSVLMLALIASGSSCDEPDVVAPPLPDAAPEAPTNVRATPEGLRTLRVQWDDMSDDEEGFQVYRGPTASTVHEFVGALGPDTESMLDSGLEPDTTYFYRVSAYKGSRTSPSAPSSGRTLSPLIDTAIVLSDDAVEFTASAGGPDPAPRVVFVSGAGAGSIGAVSTEVTYQSGSGWLDATVDLVPTPFELQLAATVGSLAPGRHVAQCVVRSPNAGIEPRSVSVTLTVGASGNSSIDVSQTSLSFTASEGGLRPSAQTISITNGGSVPLVGVSSSVVYQDGSDWLDTSLSDTSAPAALTVSPRVDGLSSGLYRALVRIDAPDASNGPVDIQVSMSIGAGPSIALSRNSVSYSARAGGSDPAPQTVTITNGGGGSLSGISVVTNQPWLDATISRTTAPCTLQVQPRLRSLPAGTFSAEVEVRASDAANSPKKIFVVFNVSNPARHLTIVNSGPSGAFLGDVVQLKIIPKTQTFGTADLLAEDGRCWSLPQSTIGPGRSLEIDVDLDDYYVFIGMGRWENDLTGLVCGLSSFPWWKRTYTTTADWQNLWVWVSVDVTDHQGDWTWTISGNYTTYSLQVTPAGNAPINFNVTDYDPIGGSLALEDARPTEAPANGTTTVRSFGELHAVNGPTGTLR